MTKVLLQFHLRKPLDDELMKRISDAHTLYGIFRVKLAPTLDRLSVEYDATRLRPEEVEGALAGVGIPIERMNVP